MSPLLSARLNQGATRFCADPGSFRRHLFSFPMKCGCEPLRATQYMADLDEVAVGISLLVASAIQAVLV